MRGRIRRFAIELMKVYRGFKDVSESAGLSGIDRHKVMQAGF